MKRVFFLKHGQVLSMCDVNDVLRFRFSEKSLAKLDRVGLK